MMDDREEASIGRIEAARRVHRKASGLCVARGASIEEAAIGIVFAAFDQVERHAGREMAAIEWMRTAIDVLEQGVMKGVRRAEDAG